MRRRTSSVEPSLRHHHHHHHHQTNNMSEAATATGKSDNTILSERFYGEYFGHPIRDLKVLLPKLREQVGSGGVLIWTAGDSSLDNKHWFRSIRPAPPGAYRDLLRPPTSNADVTYWLNHHLLHQHHHYHDRSGTDETEAARRRRMVAINTAVEATTVNERTFQLRKHDAFLRDNIQPQDILVVSVGGNDVAFKPLPCTVASVLGLVYCCPTSFVERGCSFYSVPLDDRCCGFGPSLLSCLCAFPPCLGYMRHLFGTRVQKYVDQITSKTRPKKILICTIYYPDEAVAPSWAGFALAALRYNSHPEKVQMMIHRLFTDATSTIKIPGAQVIPVPLFRALDGKVTRDYVARVEPSPQGGQKMAELILDIIDRSEVAGGSSKSTMSRLDSKLLPSAPPGATHMEDRD